MESLVMGFALLLVMKNQSNATLVVGGVIALLLILTAGMLRKTMVDSGFNLADCDDCIWVYRHPLFFLGRFFRVMGCSDCGGAQG